MEDKNYLVQKKKKKKSALKAVWVILLLAVIFIVVVAKFALSGGDDVTAIFSGMPSSDDVYAVSKQFVLPTLKGSGAKFSDDGYQFGKKQDSVFVIRSVVETTLNSGDMQKTNYEIMLRYKGGAANNQNSYELLNLNEE
ncbi:hypothetical protein [Mucilaginibacter sp.]